MRTKSLLAITIGIVFLTVLFVGNVSAQATSAAATKTVADPSIVSVAATTVTLSASTTAPAIGQSVTFTATLKSGSTPLSAKPVTIYHYFNYGRTDDVTANTNAHGQVTETTSFASAGQRNYYATFGGDSSYAAATSNVLVINVR